MFNAFPYVCIYIYIHTHTHMCVCVCIGRFSNRSLVEMKTPVADRRKHTHVVREKNIYTMLQMAVRGVNHPRLPNSEIKESVRL